MDRRTILRMLGATWVAGSARMSLAETRIDHGEMTIWSASDGNLVLPGAFFFQDLPEDEVTEILTRYGLGTDQLLPPCNVTVMQRGDQTVLFDVGSGSGFMSSAGDLQDSLDSIGIAPEDVTHVVFTHGHPDHLWGVLDDFDDLVFPNAAHLMGASELDFWRDPDTVETIGQERASFAVGAARRLSAIDDVITPFDAGQEILPGIMAHATFGHTPGHMSFELRSGSNSLLVVGDAIVNHHVAFERPEWPSGSDQDPETGAATRLRLLDQLATDKMRMLGFHLPHGGFGRVERAATGYRFLQEDE